MLSLTAIKVVNGIQTQILGVKGKYADCHTNCRSNSFFKLAFPGIFFFTFVLCTIKSKYCLKSCRGLAGFEPGSSCVTALPTTAPVGHFVEKTSSSSSKDDTFILKTTKINYGIFPSSSFLQSGNKRNLNYVSIGQFFLSLLLSRLFLVCLSGSEAN